MKVLVYLESKQQVLKSTYQECVRLARQVDESCEIHGVSLMPLKDTKALSDSGITQVFQADTEHAYTYEHALSLLEQVDLGVYDLIVVAGSATGRDLAPRLSARLKCPIVSEVIAVRSGGATPVFVKPLFSGKCFADLKVTAKQCVVSPRVNTFTTDELKGSSDCAVSSLSIAPSKAIKLEQVIVSETTRLDLTEASIVVSGGRAMGNAENFSILESLSKVIPNSTVGASRAAVDSGYAPHDYQVGQTGKTVSPKLYIACGISGAIQHLAGMRTSECIVAINTDADAPLLSIADYGIVGDLFEVVPVLEKVLQEQSAAA